MRDLDIRRALHRELGSLCEMDPSTKVVDELALCLGEARIDVAVINGCLSGYEIKSERDTLDRLPGQATIYNRTLDFVTIVASSQHLDRIVDIVPNWWGVERAEDDGLETVLLPEREGARNPAVDPFSLVQLLWRGEALDALRELGLEKGLLSKPKRTLWRKLAEAMSLDELGAVVRAKLKARDSWRAD